MQCASPSLLNLHKSRSSTAAHGLQLQTLMLCTDLYKIKVGEGYGPLLTLTDSHPALFIWVLQSS